MAGALILDVAAFVALVVLTEGSLTAFCRGFAVDGFLTRLLGAGSVVLVLMTRPLTAYACHLMKPLFE